MNGRHTGAAILSAFVSCGLAATASPAQANPDPPERAGRISFIAGTTSFRAASATDWAPAILNYPVTIGDHLWTDRAGRLELQLGGVTVDADAFTALSVLSLDRGVVQVRVTEGTLIARVRGIDEDDAIEVDTPNAAVSLIRPGIYRIDVPPSGDSSSVTVRGGEVEIAAGGSAFPVHAGQTAALAGLDQPTREINRPEPLDEFEDWVTFRARRADALQSERYVSRATVGYEDLDEFGTWRVVGAYGPVWVPHVRAEWVPYRFGHWAWVEPWGWTWVDDAPWGFAPFHYGRWVYVTDGWAWVPGTIVARPVYAPALVAFVGGANWRIGVSIGQPVGWFPLGPREVYVPAYQVSPVYVQAINRPHVSVTNINVTNVTNVTYVNRTVAGAVTVVPRDAFVQSRAVAASAVAVPPQSVAAAQVVGSSAPAGMRPVVARAAAPVAAPPAAVVSRPVVVRMRPAAQLQQSSAAPPAPGAPSPAVAPPAPAAAPAAASRPAVNASAPGGGRTAGAGTVAPVVAAPIVRSSGVERAVARPPLAETRAPVPPPAPAPAPATSAAPNVPAAATAARQAQERVDVEARHAQERADLQAKQQAEIEAHQRAANEAQQRAANEARQRAEASQAQAQMQARHAQERADLEAKQKREHAELQQRQEAERRKR